MPQASSPTAGERADRRRANPPLHLLRRAELYERLLWMVLEALAIVVGIAVGIVLAQWAMSGC